MNKPYWVDHPVSKERALDLGLVGEPECGACAEWIYCGTIHAAHTCGREKDGELVVEKG